MVAPRFQQFLTRAPDGGSGLRVLIVEDLADAAQSLAVLLRLAGHEAIIAPNGPSALEMEQLHKPDIVLLDIGLPGMNGFEVARQINARRPQRTPFLLALTGYGQDLDREKSREAGVDLHWVKPFDPSLLLDFLETFRAFLGKRSDTGGEGTRPR